MPYYTADEAARRLPELLAKAAEGEDVVITRPDEDQIRLVPAEAKPMTLADIEWLRARRVTPLSPVDSTALIRQMRDEGA